MIRPLLSSAAALAPMALAAATATVERPSAPPKLAVVIAVDQLRADYLVRFRPYLAEGGFRRLLEGGRDFRDCRYAHAYPATAPGHATIATGAQPEQHGIVANDWVDRGEWASINAVEDTASPLVGIRPDEMGPTAAARPLKTGRSPKNLETTTVADALKIRHGARSKVIAISNKDRGAILLGGKLGDAAYWDERGRMVTAKHYTAELPAWVAAFNAERRAEAHFGATWERLLDPKIYEAVQGPDDVEAEGGKDGFDRTFPHAIDGGKKEITSSFYEAWDHSPFAAEALGEFIVRAIREEKLGQREVTDMLCLSFSQLDTIGHAFGPDSHEVMDSLLRLDRVIERLLNTLDQTVGLRHCVIVLTADHGVAPMPERIKALRPDFPTGRVSADKLDNAVRQAFETAFGAPPENDYWFLRVGSTNLSYHLRPTALATKKIPLAEAMRVAKTALLEVPFVAHAFTRDELAAVRPDEDSIAGMARRASHPTRTGDVFVVLKPFYMSKSDGGSTHSSPYSYDTHVPLVWFGAGVTPGVEHQRVHVHDLAPTLAALMGLQSPPDARGRILF